MKRLKLQFGSKTTESAVQTKAYIFLDVPSAHAVKVMIYDQTTKTIPK